MTIHTNLKFITIELMESLQTLDEDKVDSKPYQLSR